jgi:hypothetical protein
MRSIHCDRNGRGTKSRPVLQCGGPGRWGRSQEIKCRLTSMRLSVFARTPSIIKVVYDSI